MLLLFMRIFKTASCFILIVQLLMLDGATLFAGLTPTSDSHSSNSSESSSASKENPNSAAPLVLRKRKLPREMAQSKRPKAKVCPASLNRVLFDDLAEVRTLGHGQFGTVYQARLAGIDVVIKSLQIKTGFRKVEQEFERQRSAGALGAAPQVLGEIFCLKNGDVETFAFAMESYPHAITLSQLAQDIQEAHEDQRKKIIQKVDMLALNTLNKLHEGQIAHNDMAPENMLVIRASNSIDDIENVLLIDFGVEDEHEGHPDYHANISLQVSPFHRDTISLLLIFLEMTREYTPCSPKLEIQEFRQRLKNSPWMSTSFKNEMNQRLELIINEHDSDETSSIYQKDRGLLFL